MRNDAGRSPAERSDEIEQLIQEVVTRRAKGEELSDEDLVDEFPHLAPELGRQLRLLGMVEAARRRAGSSPEAETLPFAAGQSTPKTTETAVSWTGTVSSKQAASRTVVGRFELVERLGQGGFATVWKAYDPHLDRWVAVKIPKHADLSASEGELFLREARAASQVRHANVVRLHEVGRDDDSIYLVSDLIVGLPLNQWCEKLAPALRKKAQLCETIAQALAAIHESGIVHRDLKPSNILVDGSDNPFITDFGLAKRGSAEATLTLDGQLMGTPAYMSPEQARGEAREAGAASDIYSFGVMFYEMLTGVLPFRGQPHQILAQTISSVPPSPRTFDPSIPRDLETICLRCLEKDPAKRFTSATDLAEELGRFLRGEPIVSRPISTTRRAIRWCRRKPLQATLTAVLCLLAVSGPLLALRERSHARLEAELRVEADLQRASSNRRAVQAESRRKEAEAAELQARRFQYASDMLLAQNALQQGDVMRAQELLERHFPTGNQEDLRGFEWYHYWNQAHPAQLGAIAVDSDGESAGTHLVISNDGRYAATDYSYVWIAIVDLQSQRVVAKIYAGFNVTGLWLDSQQRRLFAVGHEGTLRWWEDWDVAANHAVEAHDGKVNALLPLPDQSGFLTCGDDGFLKYWSKQPDRPTRVVKLPDDAPCRGAAISPDMKSVAALQQASNAIGYRASLHVYTGDSDDLRWSRILLRNEPMEAVPWRRLAFSPDGQELVYAKSAEELMFFATDSGESLQTYQSRDMILVWIGYSPEGTRLAGLGLRGTHVYLWDTATRETLTTAFPHEQVRSAGWTPDGQLVTSGPKGIFLWDSAAPTSRRIHSLRLLGAEIVYVDRTARCREKDRFLVNPNWPSSSLWDVAAGRKIHTFLYYHLAPRLMSDGSTVVSRDGNKLYRQSVDDPWPKVMFALTGPDESVDHFTLSPDDRTAAIVKRTLNGVDRTNSFKVLLWDLEQERVLDEFDVGPTGVNQLTFSPDSHRVLMVDSGGKISCWDVARREFTWHTRLSQGFYKCIVFAEDTPLLAVGDDKGNVTVLEANRGEQLHSFSSAGLPVNDILFAPGGRELVVAYGLRSGTTGEICIWDLATDLPVARLGKELGPAMGITLSADGKTLVSAHREGRVVFWDSATDAEVESQRTRH